MFYTYLRGLVIFILWTLNGNAHYHNKEKIPSKDENYILVAPHRTWWDPVYMAFATKPKQFIFMAKKQLFENRVDSHVWCLSYRPAKSWPVSYQVPCQYAEKEQSFPDYVPKRQPPFYGCQGRSGSDC